jgi:hypothetical protein
MARFFTKDVSNYVSLGAAAIGPLIDGAAAISVHAWVRPSALSNPAGNNRVLSVKNGNGSGKTGLVLSMGNNTAGPVLRVVARSSDADTDQVKASTTALTAGNWWSIGAVADFSAGTLTPFLNGIAEGGGAATFGSATYVKGVVGTQEDLIGTNISPPSQTGPIWPGDLAEIAIWRSDIGASGFAALKSGYSAALISARTLVFHLPLWGRSLPEPEFRNGKTAQVFGATVSDHPRLILASSPQGAARPWSTPVPFANCDEDGVLFAGMAVHDE